MNKATLIGRVGRDPEVRRTGAGDPVVNFSMATSETWKDKSTGERKERVEWHNVVIFNEGIGRVAEQYVKKGSQIAIEGAIQTREYTDRDGVKRKSTEIVLQRFGGHLELLGSRGDGQGRNPDDYGTTTTREPHTTRGPGFGRADPSLADKRMSDIIDDDIPF